MGRWEGCFEIQDRQGKTEHHPYFEKEMGECVLQSGNYVSIEALIDLALWNIDTRMMTKENRAVAVLKNLEDDSHVRTRVAQYRALENGKGTRVAKQLVLSKIEGQRKVLRKYGLQPIDPRIENHIERLQHSGMETSRRKINGLEGDFRTLFQPDFKSSPRQAQT